MGAIQISEILAYAVLNDIDEPDWFCRMIQEMDNAFLLFHRSKTKQK